MVAASSSSSRFAGWARQRCSGSLENPDAALAASSSERSQSSNAVEWSGQQDPSDLEAGRQGARKSMSGIREIGLDLPASARLYASDALKVLRAAAVRDDVKAQVALGIALLCGHGCTQDVPMGLSWLRKAADAGSASAQLKLVEVSAISGRRLHRWLRKAVHETDPCLRAHAMCVLGLQCSRGKIEGGWAKAVQWWTQAAAMGHAVSQRNLGLAYLEGRGVSAMLDQERAIQMLKQAEAAGLQDAHRVLVSLGRDDPDAPTATKVLHAAAMSGDPEAQFDLGCAFTEGKDGPRGQSALRLLFWQRMTGAGRAACGQGEVVNLDLSQALAWWQRAADAGLGEAMCNVAVAHSKGLVVQQDMEKAVRLFTAAAKKGYLVAEIYLERIKSKALESPSPCRLHRTAPEERQAQTICEGTSDAGGEQDRPDNDMPPLMEDSDMPALLESKTLELSSSSPAVDGAVAARSPTVKEEARTKAEAEALPAADLTHLKYARVSCSRRARAIWRSSLHQVEESQSSSGGQTRPLCEVVSLGKMPLRGAASQILAPAAVVLVRGKQCSWSTRCRLRFSL